MSNRTTAYLSLGSNLGDRKGNLLTARGLIEERTGILDRVSSLFETAPWGYESRNPFYNCCLAVSTFLKPLPLLDTLLGIEQQMGRRRSNQGYSDRLIDVDILFYGDIAFSHPRLTLPHPSTPERLFVLVPLEEIAPELKDPVSGRTVREMLEFCSDPSSVKRVEDQTRWNSTPSQNL